MMSMLLLPASGCIINIGLVGSNVAVVVFARVCVSVSVCNRPHYVSALADEIQCSRRESAH